MMTNSTITPTNIITCAPKIPSDHSGRATQQEYSGQYGVKLIRPGIGHAASADRAVERVRIFAGNAHDSFYGLSLNIPRWERNSFGCALGHPSAHSFRQGITATIDHARPVPSPSTAIPANQRRQDPLVLGTSTPFRSPRSGFVLLLR